MAQAHTTAFRLRRPLFNPALLPSDRLENSRNPDPIVRTRVAPLARMHIACLGIIRDLQRAPERVMGQVRRQPETRS